MRVLTVICLCTAGISHAADLNVYTYDSFTTEWGPGPKLEAAFEAQCECDLVFTPAGDGAAMLSRLQIEGNKTDADIALGLDNHLLERASAEIDFLDLGVETQTLSGTDVKFEDSYFRAYDWGYFAFIYDHSLWQNTDRTSEIPTSLEALANGEYSIVIQNPRSSTPGLGLANWVAEVYGDDAEGFWARIKDNIVTVTPGWSEAYSLFLEDEIDMVLSYTTSSAYHRIVEGETRYQVAKFEEGHPMQIEVAGILSSSPNYDLAKDFLDFILSPEAQVVIANNNWMYPVTEIDLPKEFDAPNAFRPLQIKGDSDAAIKAFEAGLGS